MSGAVLQATDIAVRYSSAPDIAKDILRHFDFQLGAGEIVSILGPSGIGKSSLLRILAGLQSPASGTVTLDGAVLRSPHPRIAVAFQDPSLLPWLTLERNVAFGLDFKHQPKLSRFERKERIDTAINEVGLNAARRLFPDQLSGGMAQRTALARCLARKPDILLLDEPFGALDEITRAQMQNLLLQIVHDFGTAAILITHDIDEALLVSDRIVLLGGSPAHQVGEWSIEVPKPREDYVAELGKIRVDIVSILRRAMRSH